MTFPKIFSPMLPGATFTDRAWACLGALAGIGVTALLGVFSFGHDPNVPFLVAPLGASAVLVFAVPTSPLAQPWSVVGGNTIGALVGIAVARFVSDPALACGLAVALAIAAMSLARCLHPPGGAAALTGVLGGPTVAAAGFTFAFTPVALDSVMLVLTGVLFHRVSRHRYPHRAARPPFNSHSTGDRLPEQRVGFDTRDVDAALADIGETFDIDREDLDVLLRRIKLRAVARQSGDPSCADVMSRELVTIGLRADLDAARALMLWHAIRSLPVIGEKGRLVGMVTLAGTGARCDARAAHRIGRQQRIRSRGQAQRWTQSCSGRHRRRHAAHRHDHADGSARRTRAQTPRAGLHRRLTLRIRRSFALS